MAVFLVTFFIGLAIACVGLDTSLLKHCIGSRTDHVWVSVLCQGLGLMIVLLAIANLPDDSSQRLACLAGLALFVGVGLSLFGYKALPSKRHPNGGILLGMVGRLFRFGGPLVVIAALLGFILVGMSIR
jgi:hypothetical protein